MPESKQKIWRRKQSIIQITWLEFVRRITVLRMNSEIFAGLPAAGEALLEEFGEDGKEVCGGLSPARLERLRRAQCALLIGQASNASQWVCRRR